MNISEISTDLSSYLQKLQSSSATGVGSSSAAGAASLNTLFAQVQNDIQLQSNDFKALRTALKNNNLAAATQAYATVQQDFKNIPSVAGVQSPLDPTTTVGKDFAALGAALSSGNLTAAQSAMTAFQHDMGGVSALKGLYQDGSAAVSANSGSQNSTLTSFLSKLGINN